MKITSKFLFTLICGTLTNVGLAQRTFHVGDKLPELNRIQQDFGERISAILVTTSKKAVIEGAAKRFKQFMENRLPIAYEDTILFKSLDLKTVPFFIWVYPSGKVAGITSGDYLTKANVSAFLSGTPLNWKEAVRLSGFDYGQPMMKPSRDSLTGVSYWRTVFPYQDGLNSVEFRDSSAKHKRLAIFNVPLLNLYLSAFTEEMGVIDRNRLAVRPHLLPRLFQESDTLLRSQWREKNGYGYEASVPASWTWSQIKSRMAMDLNDFLGWTVHVEEREVDCWVITMKGKVLNESNWEKTSKSPNHYSLPSFLRFWNSSPDNPIVLTDIAAYVNRMPRYMEIRPEDRKSINALSRALRKYGLRIYRDSRRLKFLVFE
jgi:hypothetical protein